MRAQALIILATFASLAGVAIAEETVEKSTDGRLILLRDDGRYEILPAGTLALPACKPAEGYTERDVLAVERDQQQLIEQHRKVCVVARLEESTEKIASLAILEAPESVESTSGWVDLSTQREEVSQRGVGQQRRRRASQRQRGPEQHRRRPRSQRPRGPRQHRFWPIGQRQRGPEQLRQWRASQRQRRRGQHRQWRASRCQRRR